MGSDTAEPRRRDANIERTDEHTAAFRCIVGTLDSAAVTCALRATPVGHPYGRYITDMCQTWAETGLFRCHTKSS